MSSTEAIEPDERALADALKEAAAAFLRCLGTKAAAGPAAMLALDDAMTLYVAIGKPAAIESLARSTGVRLSIFRHS